jgi:hypothetical protein
MLVVVVPLAALFKTLECAFMRAMEDIQQIDALIETLTFSI